MKFEVIVQPKKEVLDPEARAIQKSLTGFGFESLKQVEISKRYVLDFAGSDQEEGFRQAKKMAEDHLANPVAERFAIKSL